MLSYERSVTYRCSSWILERVPASSMTRRKIRLSIASTDWGVLHELTIASQTTGCVLRTARMVKMCSILAYYTTIPTWLGTYLATISALFNAEQPNHAYPTMSAAERMLVITFQPANCLELTRSFWITIPAISIPRRLMIR